jgi:hypothetical protein
MRDAAGIRDPEADNAPEEETTHELESGEDG